MQSMSNLAFDSKRDSKCSKCGLLVSVCQCDAHVDLKSQQYKAFLSVETRGSSDDVLTVIEKLPASEPYLKTLLRKISNECQTRGTFKMDKKHGMIEVYGDKRIKIRSFFEKEKIEFVG